MTMLIDSVLDTYLRAYRDLIAVERVDSSVVLSFPLHLAAGHRIELTITDLGGNRCTISDSARTLGEVQAAGYSLTSHMKQRLERVAGLSDIGIVNNHLVLECTHDEVGNSIQQFLEISKTIGDVYLVHKQREKPDDEVILLVQTILNSMGRVYRTDEKIAGEIESHPFDIVVPPNGHPGLAVSVLSGQNTHNVAQIWYFKCDDIKKGQWYRRSNGRLALIYDVRNQIWSDTSKAILASRADLAVPSDSLDELREFL